MLLARGALEVHLSLFKTKKSLLILFFIPPEFIGGTVSLDTKVIKASKGKIFCKSGAEGVFLFVDFRKEISGVIKITDGNERAIPITILNIFKKFKIMSKVELKNLEKEEKFELKNHAGKNIGRIRLRMK